MDRKAISKACPFCAEFHQPRESFQVLPERHSRGYDHLLSQKTLSKKALKKQKEICAKCEANSIAWTPTCEQAQLARITLSRCQWLKPLIHLPTHSLLLKLCYDNQLQNHQLQTHQLQTHQLHHLCFASYQGHFPASS